MKNTEAVKKAFVTERVALNNFNYDRVLFMAKKLQVRVPQLY